MGIHDMGDQKKHILLVEDNAIGAKVAKGILVSLNCEVTHVEDGVDAVAMALKNPYAVICMDIGLITMSGVEACIAIRKHEAERNLDPMPIVAVTANNSPEEAEEYIKAGMQAVIHKPLTKEKAQYLLSFCR